MSRPMTDDEIHDHNMVDTLDAERLKKAVGERYLELRRRVMKTPEEQREHNFLRMLVIDSNPQFLAKKKK